MLKEPRTLRIDFGAETLTHCGGVYLLHRFLTRIGFKHAVARHILLVQRTYCYSVGEMFLAVLYPMILALERIETTHLLKQNGVFQYLTWLHSYPNPTTVRRFLFRVARRHSRNFAGCTIACSACSCLLAWMTARPHPPPRLVFDVDSTVLVLYGKQWRDK